MASIRSYIDALASVLSCSGGLSRAVVVANGLQVAPVVARALPAAVSNSEFKRRRYVSHDRAIKPRVE
jgi:hypothetical protein